MILMTDQSSLSKDIYLTLTNMERTTNMNEKEEMIAEEIQKDLEMKTSFILNELQMMYDMMFLYPETQIKIKDLMTDLEKII